jgi:hypothetical protein
VPWLRTSPELIPPLAAMLLACGCAGPLFPDEPETTPTGIVVDELPAPPPFPKAGELRPVNLGRLGSFDYLVDPASISVQPGGIVRYTLVARSTGATNVSFEALSCGSRERRVYALGRPDGTWATARISQWLRIDSGTASLPYVELARSYFCPNRAAVKTSQEAIDAVNRGGHPDTVLRY